MFRYILSLLFSVSVITVSAQDDLLFYTKGKVKQVVTEDSMEIKALAAFSEYSDALLNNKSVIIKKFIDNDVLKCVAKYVAPEMSYNEYLELRLKDIKNVSDYASHLSGENIEMTIVPTQISEKFSSQDRVAIVISTSTQLRSGKKFYHEDGKQTAIFTKDGGSTWYTISYDRSVVFCISSVLDITLTEF